MTKLFGLIILFFVVNAWAQKPDASEISFFATKDSSNKISEEWKWSIFSGVSKGFMAGKTPLNLTITPKFYTDEETTKPDIGLRAMVTFMFPE